MSLRRQARRYEKNFFWRKDVSEKLTIKSQNIIFHAPAGAPPVIPFQPDPDTTDQAAASSIRAAVRRTDPNLSALTFRTVDDQLDRLLISERMLSILAGIFAAVATFLAMIGLYGVLSFSAASRVKEIGIRLALGASRGEAGGMIIREAAILAVTGLAIALPASWTLGRLIESQLFGVRPMDILSIISAGGILTLVCLIASAVPARKAALVSPLEALKGD